MREEAMNEPTIETESCDRQGCLSDATKQRIHSDGCVAFLCDLHDLYFSSEANLPGVYFHRHVLSS